MFYEFEGRYNMETLTFDDDCLMVGNKCYPYSDIESLEITSAQLFSNYGILTLTVEGKEIPVPFPRSYAARLKRAIKEMEREQAKKSRPSGINEYSAGFADSMTDNVSYVKPVSPDPYDELKKLKELLDLDIITHEEFDMKKKQLLDL